ncbi:hypothetical protein GCM10023169_13250 [Georgenia halophila]|uniref:YihY/virulence factor BrkB family protein n=1 Tax=Georgenia halophila TaxID=620889 RepID=A0ABP8L2J4_9MICO
MPPADEKEQGRFARLKAAFDRLRRTRPGRSLDRYTIARGNLLAGGIAYAALFSISAALTISWTAFMAVLGGNAGLRSTVLEAIDDALPGLLKETADDENGMISPDTLVLDTAITPASIVALIVLVWTSLRVMSALRSSIRAMFGIVAPPENIGISKVRDLLGFVVLAVGILLSSVLGALASTLAETVLGLVGLDGAVTSLTVRIAGLGMALVVDWGVFIMLFRYTAGVRPPRRDLLTGTLLGAVAVGGLRLLGTTLLGTVDDPLLAPFAALVALMLWVNVAARIVLVVAAFTANPPAPVRPESAEDVHLDERPNYVTESVPRTREWDHQPLTGVIEPANARPEPEPEPVSEPRPGLAARLRRRRIARLERRLTKARKADAVLPRSTSHGDRR